MGQKGHSGCFQWRREAQDVFLIHRSLWISHLKHLNLLFSSVKCIHLLSIAFKTQTATLHFLGGKSGSLLLTHHTGEGQLARQPAVSPE